MRSLKHILFSLIGVGMVGGGLVYFNSSNKKSEELSKSKNYKKIAEKVNKNLGTEWGGATLPEPNDSWWSKDEIDSHSRVLLSPNLINLVPDNIKKNPKDLMNYCYEKIENYTSYPQNDETLCICLKPVSYA